MVECLPSLIGIVINPEALLCLSYKPDTLFINDDLNASSLGNANMLFVINMSKLIFKEEYAGGKKVKRNGPQLKAAVYKNLFSAMKLYNIMRSK